MKDLSYIDRNVTRVMERIGVAARAAGRDPADVTLLAAVKYAEPDEITRLYDAGIRLVGENRVQQFTEHEAVPGYERFGVHFIGTLQTNKVKYIAGKIKLVESLDSEKLAAELDRQSGKAGTVTDVLCEINSGREENKSGIFPELAGEFCEKIKSYPNLRLCGFMTMAPVCDDKAEYRKYFSETRGLAGKIWKDLGCAGAPVLSMGMSGSFEEAVLEGATVVRVGRGLFAKD